MTRIEMHTRLAIRISHCPITIWRGDLHIDLCTRLNKIKHRANSLWYFIVG